MGPVPRHFHTLIRVRLSRSPNWLSFAFICGRIQTILEQTVLLQHLSYLFALSGETAEIGETGYKTVLQPRLPLIQFCLKVEKQLAGAPLACIATELLLRQSKGDLGSHLPYELSHRGSCIRFSPFALHC